MTHPLALLAAFVLAVLGTARLTRLLIHDKWPPVLEARLWFLNRLIQREERGRQNGRDTLPRWDPRYLLTFGWLDLARCQYCLAPYTSALVLAAAVWADVWRPDLSTRAGWWLLLAVWASLSYAAAIVVSYDGDDAE